MTASVASANGCDGCGDGGGCCFDTTVNLVEKDPSDWSVVPEGDSGTLCYSMGCAGIMSYVFTLNTPLEPETDYCLVFYTRNEAGTWNPDTVWDNQDTGLITSMTTNENGELGYDPVSGSFDFNDYGFGLECIDDGKDYDGTVCGAKVWLVPCDDYDEGEQEITNWNPNEFLFEEDLITPGEYCCCFDYIEMEECVCQGDEVEIEVGIIEDTCGVSEVKALFKQDGETVVEVLLTEDDSYDGTLSGDDTSTMSGDYDVDVVVTMSCGALEKVFDNVATLTVDTKLPEITEAKAIPDTISLIGMMDWYGGCDPLDLLRCECEACYQTHSYGPSLTTLVVDATDECKGISRVTRDYSAIIEQMFGEVIEGFTADEKEAFDETLAALLEEESWIEEFEPCYDGESCYKQPMLSFGPAIAFFIVCMEADIHVDMPTILLEQIQLGDIEIPITVEDKCGNVAETTITVTIVDYQIPLKEEWNVRSVPITLECSKWGEIAALGDDLNHGGAYRFNSEEQVFQIVTADYEIAPLEAFYVYMYEKDQMPILLERDATSPPTRELSQGYNLIGPAILPFETMRTDLCLKSVEVTPDGSPGYTNVVSLLQLVEYDEMFCEDGGECCDSCFHWRPGYYKWFVQKPWVFTAGQVWPVYTEGFGEEYCDAYCDKDCHEECYDLSWEICYEQCHTECDGSCTETCESDGKVECEGRSREVCKGESDEFCWERCGSFCVEYCGCGDCPCYEMCCEGCYGECYDDYYERCCEKYYETCYSDFTEVCIEDCEEKCLGTCIGGCFEFEYGVCNEDCQATCTENCYSNWYEYTGEVDDPKLGQDHYLCKYWMDNAAGYWVYMENSDTLAGFTSTPVYLIDPTDFGDLLEGESMGDILEELYAQAEG